jgi:hypothetical protein
MKIIPFLIVVLFFISCSTFKHSVFLPSEIDKYCSKISGVQDDNSEAKRNCIQQELNARSQLSRMTISSDTATACRRLSESTGRSYQVMLTCVQQAPFQ